MNITLSKIHALSQAGQCALHPSLVRLGVYADESFPIKRRHRLGRVIDAAIAEIKICEKHRNKLVKKYSGSEKQVPADRLEAFFEEFNELLEVEVYLPDMSITLDELSDKAPLGAIDMAALNWIIAGEDEPATEEKATAVSGD